MDRKEKIRNLFLQLLDLLEEEIKEWYNPNTMFIKKSLEAVHLAVERAYANYHLVYEKMCEEK